MDWHGDEGVYYLKGQDRKPRSVLLNIIFALESGSRL